MKKIFLFIIVIIGFYSIANAQLTETEKVKKSLQTENKDTAAWIHEGIFNIGVNQGFLHNWAAGGEVASLTINGLFSGYITRLHHNSIWTNNLDLAYGLFYAYSNDFRPRKTDDRIDFTSKYGVRPDTSSSIYFTGLFNFKSQFTKGYDYNPDTKTKASNSTFLSPAYFTLAAGAEYRKGTNLSLFLSPAAARLVLAQKHYTSRKPEGAFGIDSGKTAKLQFGAYFSGRYEINISKNAIFKTRLDLYSNYLAKDTKDKSGKIIKYSNPADVDVLFDNLFSYKLSKFINITVGATFIYDNDIPYEKTYVDANGTTKAKNEPGEWLGWWQLKQIFALGFEYKF